MWTLEEGKTASGFHGDKPVLRPLADEIKGFYLLCSFFTSA